MLRGSAVPVARAGLRLLREQLPRDVPEGLEFQRVAGRVEDEKRRLLASRARKARVRFDDPLDLLPPESLRELRPLGWLEHHATMRHRYPVTVDRVEVRAQAPLRAETRIEVTDELVAVEVEVDPVGRAAPFGAAENAAV